MGRTLLRVNLREVQLSKSRPTIPDTVNALSASMRQTGLINPIIVKRGPVFDGTLMVDGYRVVAGNHRVSAARALGWTDIEAFLHEGDNLAVELIEIDENLQRAELSPAQRAASVARRREIWEALHPESARIPRTSGRGYVGFSADTEKSTGESKRRLQEQLSRADKLGPDLHAVVGTSLDKAGELDALKEMEPKARKPLIEAAKRGEQVSARRPAPSSTAPPRADLPRLLSSVIADVARMAKHFTPEDVAEEAAKRAVNADLKPYMQAIYDAYRASRGSA